MARRRRRIAFLAIAGQVTLVLALAVVALWQVETLWGGHPG